MNETAVGKRVAYRCATMKGRRLCTLVVLMDFKKSMAVLLNFVPTMYDFMYSVSTNFCLDLIEPSTSEVFIFLALVKRERERGRVRRGEENLKQHKTAAIWVEIRTYRRTEVEKENLLRSHCAKKLCS